MSKKHEICFGAERRAAKVPESGKLIRFALGETKFS